MLSSFKVDFQCGGSFDGRDYLQFKDFGNVGNADKTHKISLANPWARDEHLDSTRSAPNLWIRFVLSRCSNVFETISSFLLCAIMD